jgi:hypothetical protein
MIRKLRTERDNQQWMLDLALNMRGRVQNFERDDLEVPQGITGRYPSMPESSVAMPRNDRKPVMSVMVVRKIDEAVAGS